MIVRRSMSATAWPRLAAAGVAGLLLLGWTGCEPRLEKAADVEKAIQRGRDDIKVGLHEEAEERFRGVLKQQPDSAEAHLQLGLLYFEHLKQYVPALYHLERYSQLQPKNRPESLKPDILQAMKNMCKQEIAQQVPLGDITLNLQQKLAVMLSSNVVLLSSNKALQAEVLRLRQQLAQVPPAQATPRSAATESPAQPSPVTPSRQEATEGSSAATTTPSPRRPLSQPETSQPAAVDRPRTHTIQAGDTLFSLARRYGVDPKDMVRANPTVNPNNMQIGDVVRIPGP